MWKSRVIALLMTTLTAWWPLAVAWAYVAQYFVLAGVLGCCYVVLFFVMAGAYRIAFVVVQGPEKFRDHLEKAGIKIDS